MAWVFTTNHLPAVAGRGEVIGSICGKRDYRIYVLSLRFFVADPALSCHNIIWHMLLRNMQ